MKNLLTISICLLVLNITVKAGDSASYYFNKGLEEKTAKRWLVASKNFETAIKFNANYEDAFLQLGFTNLEMRKQNQAITNFEKVIQLNVNNKDAAKELANLYFVYRQYPKAINYAQKCGGDAADKIIALSYFNQEDYIKAEPLLAALLQKTPNDAEATNTMAKCYDQLDKFDKAIVLYQKAIELDKTKTIWQTDLGDLFYDLKRYKDAIGYYEMATANGYAKSNDFLENMAFSYIYSRQPEKAEATFTQVVAKTGLKDDFCWEIIDAYYESKQYEYALNYLQKLLEKDAKNAKALYQAGLVFQKKGQTDKGKGMCDKAIEWDPSLASLRRRESIGAGL